MSTSVSTEEKMKAAAKLVFIAKGFSGCTSREIAKEAGMNVARQLNKRSSVGGEKQRGG